MALQGRGRPRYDFQQRALTSDEITRLLRKELGAKRLSDDDKVKPQPWSPTLEEIRKRQEEMGLFSHLEDKIDVAAIPVNPFEYPDGFYTVAFAGATLRPLTGDSGFEVSLDLKYTILDDDTENGKKYAGKPITEGKWIPSAHLAATDPEQAEEKLGYVIQRIAQLGFGEDASTVDVEDINAACMNSRYRVKLKKGNKEDSGQFVQSVRRIEETDMVDVL